MTHSLHRTGTPENLKDDFVVLVTPAVSINNKGSQNKLRKILDFIFDLEPTNIGSYETGTVFSGATIEEIKEKLSETPRVRVCFSSKEKVKKLVEFIKERDFGLSVTVSGLVDEIKDITQAINIQPHSINLSLGIHGKTEALPSPEVLEFVTMCGHGMISASLVEKLIADVKAGRRTPRQAAEEMARPCVCGIFNPDRAAKLLQKYERQWASNLSRERRQSMKLAYDQSKCTGCAVCASVCSFRLKGLVHPGGTRIEFAYVSPTDSHVIYCRQCENAPCALACPQGAIQKDGKTGAWVVDAEKCVGCGLCLEACPYGAIRLDTESGKADKCDLCQGDPACVKHCLAQALTVQD